MNRLLGERIRALRVAKSLTQEHVSERIGVSRQKYARMENGCTPITLELLSGISYVLDVTVADITKVLEKEPTLEYREESKMASSEKIFDMLDLFYANKHVYENLQRHERS